MKKYPFIVIPIIIVLIIGIIFIWNYKDAENNISVPTNKVVNETPEVHNEVINNVVEENTTSSENIEKEDDVIVENKVDETTTKKVETSTSSTNKATSSTKNTTLTKNVVKEEKTTQTTTKPTTQPKVENTTSKTETKKDTTEEKVVERCTNTNNHGMGVGNTNKWFSTKAEAISYYDSEVKRWGDWWESTDADDTEADATYYKNCPTRLRNMELYVLF